MATRAAKAVTARIKIAEFPALKGFDTHDFGVMPGLPKPKFPDLSRCEWFEQKPNCCFRDRDDRSPCPWGSWADFAALPQFP